MNKAVPISECEHLDKLRHWLGGKLDDYLCDGMELEGRDFEYAGEPVRAALLRAVD